jgi:hypothetical protein
MFLQKEIRRKTSLERAQVRIYAFLYLHEQPMAGRLEPQIKTTANYLKVPGEGA